MEIGESIKVTVYHSVRISVSNSVWDQVFDLAPGAIKTLVRNRTIDVVSNSISAWAWR